MPQSDIWFQIASATVIAFTTVAAIYDVRTQRIPNSITVPMFLLGVCYVLLIAFVMGPTIVVSPILGCLAGFGILFGLWLVGGVGGGDVKLMGALGVWLGLRMTLSVFVLSTIFVALIAAAWMVNRVFSRKSRPSSNGQAAPSSGVTAESTAFGIPYAGPVALATWLLLLGKLFPGWTTIDKLI